MNGIMKTAVLLFKIKTTKQNNAADRPQHCGCLRREIDEEVVEEVDRVIDCCDRALHLSRALEAAPPLLAALSECGDSARVAAVGDVLTAAPPPNLSVEE